MAVRFQNMARHKFSNPLAVSEPDLDISSLIDVCFLLLIYFLVSTTIVPREQDLGMSMPDRRGNTATPPIPPMVIRIDAQGTVFHGNGLSERQLDSDPDSRDLPQLAQQLALYGDAARSAGDEPSILFRVDANARQQRVIDVLDALAVAGISSVAFEDFVAM